ncbi:MAG: hypothetical protein IPN68_07875 [Bacteroidetes bacterium]|nr:hypothetical protein [Bacteroidota bacterium]
MKKFWLILIPILSLLKAQGQPVNSPEDIIKGNLITYCRLMPWEEIFIHSDRDEYIAGENLWFNIYLFDRQSNSITDHSSIAYFDILNADNRKVVEKRIKLDKGIGPGHILLPDTLSTGRYIIRAYTRWMSNFMPANCFVREIFIYNALNNKVLRGKPGLDGSIQPAARNKNITKDDTGLGIKVNREQSGRTEIALNADDKFLSANSPECYLIVQTQGIVSMVKAVTLKSGMVRTNVPEEIFIPGINQIVILDSKLKPVAERLIYTPFKQDLGFKIISSDTFSLREKVDIRIISALNGSDSLSALSASLSVSPVTGKPGGGDITDYLVFGSEFGFLPESFLNRRISEIPADSIDRFLLNAKSNWIDWDLVMSHKLPELKYQPEKDGHFISGQIIQKNSLEPLKGKYMFLSKPGKTPAFQYSITDGAGTFSFEVPVNDKVNDLIIQPEEPDLKSSVKIGTTLAEDLLKNDEHPDTSVFIVPDYFLKEGADYQVNKIYGISNAADPVTESIQDPVSERFYGKPDIELKMEDYILLPLMEEVFFELTPGVQLKRKGNNYSMTIEDPVTKLVHKKPPVLFIDGIFVKDPAVIAGLDPEKVERIDVIKDLYLVGDYIFFGIINVITKAGDLSGISLPEDAIRFKYRVVESVPSFISPVYSSDELKKSRIPDFRNTLYWNPSVKSSGTNNETFEFWTSDGVASYEVTLQGVNLNGEPVSFRKVITVK